MNTQNLIEPINESAKLEESFALIVDLVDKPEDIRLDWLKDHNWAAVPVEGACHFNEYDADNLAKALSFINCHSCLAVATEPLKNSTLCYKVKTTKEGLLAFSWECGSFDFVIISEDKTFAIMCTVNDYYVVAGQRDFVTVAVGGSILEARQKFLHFIQDDSWENKTKKHLLEVFHRYENFNG
ncbi:MAG: hypothetical protein ACKPFK_23645 [Dolichospermum sp.]